MRRHGPALQGLLACVLLGGCDAATELITPHRIESPRERYRQSLRSTGLDATALGADWVRAGNDALRSPVRIELPYREVAYFAADSALALGYRLTGLRGRRITAALRFSGIAPARVFADLYRVPPRDADPLELVATLDSAAAELSWEPRRDGDFVFRLQPELLRSGTVTVELRSEPALAFPVEGRSWDAVQSVFGDPRDAGARAHHGIDIFAPRGTPALAAAAGRVARVQATPRGGNVVWLRDENRGMSLYYAHLDRQAVASGQWVQPGDTVGFIGNTGNARTTPPHLHFGVYRRGEGPSDPDPWLRPWEPAAPAVRADVSALWRLMRVAGGGTRLRRAAGGAAPDGVDGSTSLAVPGRTVLRVLAASGGDYRVALPDGSRGYVPARDLESTRVPLGSVDLSASPLRAAPGPDAPFLELPTAEARADVIGVFGSDALVRTTAGVHGWRPIATLD